MPVKAKGIYRSKKQVCQLLGLLHMQEGIQCASLLPSGCIQVLAAALVA